MNKEIKIRCTGTDFLSLDEMESFQGDLKILTDENKAKLKKSLIKHGFLFPFFVWKGKDKIYYLDGHQRDKVLPELAEEGYKLPEKYPVVYIEAVNGKEAAEAILLKSSFYGEITEDGLQEFAENFELDLPEIDLNLPNIDIALYDSNNVFTPNIIPEFSTKNVDEDDLEIAKKRIQEKYSKINKEHNVVICPYCLKEFEIDK